MVPLSRHSVAPNSKLSFDFSYTVFSPSPRVFGLLSGRSARKKVTFSV